MRYLNKDQIVIIHNEVIDQTGGSKGLRDLNLLESAIARPQATFAQVDLYPDIFSKAASLGHSIISNHAFVDGNKRTGYMAMRIFLSINGHDLTASIDDRFRFVMEIANKEHDEKAIAEWLEKHSCKI